MLSSLEAPLVGLSSSFGNEKVDLSSLLKLKFLTIESDMENIKNKPALAQSLKHLNEIYCDDHNVDINDILPFLHLSPQLEKVAVYDINEEFTTIKPIVLNREREKLLSNPLYNVKKVTIHLPESNYLATKWKTTETNLRLIEMRHFESYDCNKWF